MSFFPPFSNDGTCNDFTIIRIKMGFNSLVIVAQTRFFIHVWTAEDFYGSDFHKKCWLPLAQSVVLLFERNTLFYTTERLSSSTQRSPGLPKHHWSKIIKAVLG